MVSKAHHGLTLPTSQSYPLPISPLVHDMPATLASVHVHAYPLTPYYPSGLGSNDTFLFGGGCGFCLQNQELDKVTIQPQNIWHF